MSITTLQKSIQIADDLDEQANRLNVYISDPNQEKTDRNAAAEIQTKLRQEAAKLRIDAIAEIIGDNELTIDAIDAIVSATDKAKVAANNIGEIKKGLELAAATISFFATLSTGDVPKIILAFSDFQSFVNEQA